MTEQITMLAFPKAPSRILYTQFIEQHSIPKLPYPIIQHIEFLFQEEQGVSLNTRSLNNPSMTNRWHVETATTGNRQVTQRPYRTKRPLNSWMGFRTFYSALFPTLKQKDASPYLTLLWDGDPFKAKWSIVARAYTHIRDFFGSAQPIRLDQFLNVVTPRIGIIPTHEYLTTMCWISSYEEDGSLLLTQEAPPNLGNFPRNLMSTHMTEMDVIRYCGTVGYIPFQDANQIVSDRSRQGALAQQGLLASAPPVRPASGKTRCTAKRNKRAAATSQFFQEPKFPASPDLPAFTEEACRAHWTGSMACLDMANVLEADMPRPIPVDCFDTTYMGEAQNHGFVDLMTGEDLVDWNSFVPPEQYQEALLNILQYSPSLY